MKYFIICFLVLIANSYSQNITGRVVNSSMQGLEGKKVEVHLRINLIYTKYTTLTDASGYFLANSATEVETETQLPDGYEISNNFPQPFNPKTIFYISLPKQSQITADVFTILGEKILTIDKKDYPAGSNKLVIELNGFGNGVYITRINIDDKYFVTRKLLLLYGSQHASENSLNTLNKSNATIYIDSISVIGSSIRNKTIYFTNRQIISSFDAGNIWVDSAYSITISGQIYNLYDWRNSNRGISNARIKIGESITFTDFNGNYSMTIVSGNSNVEITHPDYWTRKTKIRSMQNNIIDFDILNKTRMPENVLAFYDTVSGRASPVSINILKRTVAQHILFYTEADTNNAQDRLFAEYQKNKIDSIIAPAMFTPIYTEGFLTSSTKEIGTNPPTDFTYKTYILRMTENPPGPGGTGFAYTIPYMYTDSTNNNYLYGETIANISKYWGNMPNFEYNINRLTVHEITSGLAGIITRANSIPSVWNWGPPNEYRDMTQTDKDWILFTFSRMPGNRSPDTDYYIFAADSNTWISPYEIR